MGAATDRHRAARPREEGPALVAGQPHLALAVLLFAFGVVPLGRSSRVELETLAPKGLTYTPSIRSPGRYVTSPGC